MKKPDPHFTPMTVEEAVPHLREVADWNRRHLNREDKVFTMLSTDLVLEICERLLAVTERKTTEGQKTAASTTSEVDRLTRDRQRWKRAAIDGWTRFAGDEVEGRKMAQDAYDRHEKPR